MLAPVGSPDLVTVIAADADRSSADAIVAGMAELGVLAEPGDTAGTTASRVVAVLSRAAVVDERWQRRVGEIDATSRLVPVRLDEVDPRQVPTTLRLLNWIHWSRSHELKSRTELFAALHSDLSHYRRHRALTAEARAWADAGRPAHLLIESKEAGERARQHLADAADDVLAAPTPLIVEYVTASTTNIRRHRRRRTRRWTIRAAVAVAVTVLAVSVVVVLRIATISNNLSALGNADPVTIDHRPDRIAMLSAGILLQDGVANESLARFTLAQVLSRPWSSGVIGVEHSSRIVGAALSEEGARSLTFDGEGTLTSWDNDSLTARWRWVVPGADESGVLDADPGLSDVALATGSSLYRIDAETRQHSVVGLPAPASQIALAPVQDYVAADTDEGLFLLEDGTLARSPLVGTVLDLRQTRDGDVRALVRVGGSVRLADPRSGQVLATTQMDAHRFEKGALGADGSVAWAGADRQILRSDDDLDFQPTGQAIPDVIEVLEPLSDDRVAYGGSQFGVRIYDGRVGEVGTVCQSMVDVGALAVAADGDMVGCLDYYHLELWRTRVLSPLPIPPADLTDVAENLRDKGPDLAAVGAADGSVTLSRETATDRRPGIVLRDSGSAVTVVGLDGNHAVVAGTAAGEVFQYSVRDDLTHLSGRWRSPDGSSIVAIGREPGGADELLVRTVSGHWWRLPGCGGCQSDDDLVEQVRERLWGCYTENQIEWLGSAARTALGIRTCAPTPAAGG